MLCNFKKNNLRYNARLLKNLIPHLFVFLFSLVKAELYGSAFTVFQKDTLSISELDKARRLFESGNDSKALEISYELYNSDDLYLKIQANRLLGEIFAKNNNIEKSLTHLKKSLYLIEGFKPNLELKSQDLVHLKASVLNEISKVYAVNFHLKEAADSALFYSKKIMSLSSLDKQVYVFKAKALNNFFLVKFKEKKFDESEEYIKESISIFKKLNMQVELSSAYLNLASLYEVTTQREKALETYFKALNLIQGNKDSRSIERKEVLYYNIAWTLYNLKDYTAYEYLEKSNSIRDSLSDVSLRKELKKIEQIHSIDLIKKEEENKRARLENSMWFFGGLAVLLGLLLAMLFMFSKLKQKNLKIELSQKELEKQKDLENLRSESQIKILNAAIDGKEKERKKIAEELHDNVSAMLSSANLHLQASEKQFSGKMPPEIDKTKAIISETSQIIRNLSHNLMSSILLKFGLTFAVKDIAKKYSNSELKIFTAIDDLSKYTQEFEIKVFNIIQELTNNILKHSKATFAYITIEEEKGKLLVIVKDNGIGGVDDKDLKNSGVGISQIKARVQMMQGKITIESEIDEGTKISMEFPIQTVKSLSAIS